MSQTKTLNDSDLCPDKWLFVATPYKSDANDATKQAVDCGLYEKAFAPSPRADATAEDDVQNRRVNWSRVDLPIECKTHEVEQDPFDDRCIDGEPDAKKRKEALGQILAYAELIFKHQQRQFLFMVLFLGTSARIVRIDRSGLFATDKFNYRTEGWKLTAFLHRYIRLSREHRGYDPTAKRLETTHPLAKKMQQLSEATAQKDPDNHVQQLFAQSLDQRWPWWELQVTVHTKKAVQPDGSSEAEGEGEDPAPSQPKPEIRKYVVGRPHFQAPGVVGRGTRGYVAVAVDRDGNLIDADGHRLLGKRGKLLSEDVSSCFVYLKDAWRVDHEGIEQEGRVLEMLEEKEVPFVPHLLCDGDIPGQVTLSQQVWCDMNRDIDPSECPLKTHRHYRLVVREVGKPLDQFVDGGQLVFALWCALQGKQPASLFFHCGRLTFTLLVQLTGMLIPTQA